MSIYEEADVFFKAQEPHGFTALLQGRQPSVRRSIRDVSEFRLLSERERAYRPTTTTYSAPGHGVTIPLQRWYELAENRPRPQVPVALPLSERDAPRPGPLLRRVYTRLGTSRAHTSSRWAGLMDVGRTEGSEATWPAKPPAAVRTRRTKRRTCGQGGRVFGDSERLRGRDDIWMSVTDSGAESHRSEPSPHSARGHRGTSATERRGEIDPCVALAGPRSETDGAAGKATARMWRRQEGAVGIKAVYCVSSESLNNGSSPAAMHAGTYPHDESVSESVSEAVEDGQTSGPRATCTIACKVAR
ncbi:unnamed protein product [Boreogadus saida]